MKNNTSLPNNQNQIYKILTDNNSFTEPNIRKAKFILTKSRIYTLEFDQNITMLELKGMIQKAAHLRKNSFGLYSEGENYTQYNEETFDSLFPDKNFVIFTLEIINLGEVSSEMESEFLLQINYPCPNHNFKFLLYYCFDCGQSICSECFTTGQHKGHHIQDKCFYLLSSKYLIEKMFENWGKMPYEDYKISVDFNEYKNILNNKIFKELFQMLTDIQNKCNALIDKYNMINEKSLNNLRESVRDIKISCIKALDDYKNAINVKDIINNENIFLDFHNTYEEMGIKQKEKFRQNLQKFQQLNQEVSKLVQNLINSELDNIQKILSESLLNEEYILVENKINMNLIKPVDTTEIKNQFDEKKNKMKSKTHTRKTTFVTKNLVVPNILQNISLDISNSINNNINDKDNNNIKGRLTIQNDNNIINNAINVTLNDRDSNLWELPSNNNSSRKININVNNMNTNMQGLQSNGIPSNIHVFNDLNRNSFYSTINTNNNNNQIHYVIKAPKESKVINKGSNIPIQMQTSSHKDLHSTLYENNFQKDINNVQKSNTDVISNKNKNKIIDNTNIVNINTKIPEVRAPSVFSSIIEKNKNNIINTNINQSNSKISDNTSFKNEINNLNNARLLSLSKNEITNPFLMDNNNSNANSLSSREEKGSNNNNYNNVNYLSSTIQNNISNSNQINPFLKINNYHVSNTNLINTQNASYNNNINKDNQIKYTKYVFPIGHFHNINNIQQGKGNDNNNNIISTTINKTIINKNDNLTNNQNPNHNHNINTNLLTFANKEINNDNNFAEVLAKKIRETTAEIDNKKFNVNLEKNIVNTTNITNTINPFLELSNESGVKSKKYIIKDNRDFNIQYFLKKQFILCPILGTNKIKFITEEEKDESIIEINFPKNLGISKFLKNSSYCNYNKRLYISGGILENDTNSYSNKFYIIDLFQPSLDGNYTFISKLSPMKYSRINHSMIGYNDKIYSVGGENNDTVECYNIKTNTWETLNSMSRKRSHPILYIYNEHNSLDNKVYLYAFFGKENNQYLEDIERLNIVNEDTPQWEIILFDNPNKVDTRRYGCGLHQIDDLLYFFGGKCLGKNTDDIFFINMKERFIDKTDAKLMWKDSFRENELFKLGNKLVQTSEENNSGIYLQVLLQ